MTTPTTPPLDDKALDALLRKSSVLIVAGCDCQVKTPEITWHDNRCKYRVASELCNAITALRQRVAELERVIEAADAYPFHSERYDALRAALKEQTP